MASLGGQGQSMCYNVMARLGDLGHHGDIIKWIVLVAWGHHGDII